MSLSPQLPVKSLAFQRAVILVRWELSNGYYMVINYIKSWLLLFLALFILYIIPKTVDIHTMLPRCFSASLFRKRKQFRRFAGCPTKLLYQVQNLILSLSLPCWCWSYRCSVKCATLFVSLCCWPCYERQFSEYYDYSWWHEY